MKFAVELTNSSKKFKQTIVINELSLQVRTGILFALIGPSGGGKTTLIKMIMGMLKSDTGTVTALNKKVPNKQLLHDIGYMAQADALYTDLTGQENLEFFGKMYAMSKKELQDRITYASNIVDLADHLSKKVEDYSGGMKRRLSLAIALIQDPPLLILDEPTVGIDPLLKLKIWQELTQLKNQGKTIFVTTHAMDEAEKCDEIAMLREGSIIATGTPFDLKQQFNAADLDEVFLQAGGETQ
ncbi:ABC transporter ATP-binding protein [Kurthia sibirica]|uniref:Glycosyl transferase family 2 n=1 Tax=Kurthia sibirica TaxID=202750 RepID=A0A2U3AH30_9BACL|nr:ABC transporter ATP-binding protein [Kurthia sibirica]PWI23872.1 glycosyl transferase family 2 [Kurthia sibirica]GEK35053.1 ABC transporter ATP-binding protein [Kurthia sibirica]